MNILLVDDERLIVVGLSKIIQRQYPESIITYYTNPLEAVVHMQTRLPDLLITDIRMPEMMGLDLIAKARDMGLKYYALLTGLNDVSLLQDSIRLHAFDYLFKPVNKTELFSLLDRVKEQLSNDTQHTALALPELFKRAMISDEEMIKKLYEQMRRSDCPPDVLDAFFKDIGRAVPYWEVCRFAAEILSQKSMDPLCARLRSYPLRKTPGSADVQASVNKADKQYAEDLTLAQIAADAYLQPNYFSTLFKKEMGVGFVQYLNQVRIDAACYQMLHDPLVTLNPVALSSGFQSFRYFFSVFKRFTGTTPGLFREELIKAGFIRS